jgi:hypothetical protein
MQRIILLAVFGMLTATAPARAQDGNPGPVLRDGEIVIPSERVLEREAVTQPRNEFSSNDADALRQMERQDRRIDREVEKGICTDC